MANKFLDNNGVVKLVSLIKATYPKKSEAIKAIVGSGNKAISYTKADGSQGSFNYQDTTYQKGTASALGLTKLFDSVEGTATDGAPTQKAINEKLEALKEKVLFVPIAENDTVGLSSTSIIEKLKEGSFVAYIDKAKRDCYVVSGYNEAGATPRVFATAVKYNINLGMFSCKVATLEHTGAQVTIMKGGVVAEEALRSQGQQVAPNGPFVGGGATMVGCSTQVNGVRCDTVAGALVNICTYVDALKSKIEALTSVQFKKVTSLPTTSKDTAGVIYLMPSGKAGGKNMNKEYIDMSTVHNDSTTPQWEVLGTLEDVDMGLDVLSNDDIDTIWTTA